MKKIALLSLSLSALIFTGCNSINNTASKLKINTSDLPITNKTWIVTHIHGEAIKTEPTDRNIPSLLLTSEGNRLSGADGCNRLIGNYTITSNKLKFGTIGSTMMACLDENIQKTAQQYGSALDKVEAYQATPSTLILKDKDGKALIQFTSAVQPR